MGLEEIKEIIISFWYAKYGKTFHWKMNDRTRQEIEELAKLIEATQWE